jgi:hypothetical protein
VTGPTFTNGGIILLVLAIGGAYFLWKYFRHTDNILGRRCERCGEQLHSRTPEQVHYCSEYCQQRAWADQRSLYLDREQSKED